MKHNIENDKRHFFLPNNSQMIFTKKYEIMKSNKVGIMNILFEFDTGKALSAFGGRLVAKKLHPAN